MTCKCECLEVKVGRFFKRQKQDCLDIKLPLIVWYF